MYFTALGSVATNLTAAAVLTETSPEPIRDEVLARVTLDISLLNIDLQEIRERQSTINQIIASWQNSIAYYSSLDPGAQSFPPLTNAQYVACLQVGLNNAIASRGQLVSLEVAIRAQIARFEAINQPFNLN
jgi:hypothetical protein